MRHVWHLLKDLEPYILQLLLGGIAIGGLVKDWRDYGEKFGRLKYLRWLILLATIVVFLLTLVDTHQSRREAREKEQQAQEKDTAYAKQIDVLTEQIHLEREENKHNSDGFRESFDALYSRYSDLAGKVQNADLLQEIKQTRDELRATQVKLTQPKPRLIASFYRPDMTNNQATKEIDVVKSKEGTITVDFVTINNGDGPALKGGVSVRICWACQYAKEPQGSMHVPGSPDQDREFPFEHIFSQSMNENETIEIKPQPFVNRFGIDVHYVCENCATDTQTLWINVVPEMRFPRNLR